MSFAPCLTTGNKASLKPKKATKWRRQEQCLSSVLWWSYRVSPGPLYSGSNQLYLYYIFISFIWGTGKNHGSLWIVFLYSLGSEEHIGTPIELLRPPLFKLFKSSDFGKGKKAWSILYFQKPSDDGHTLFGLRIVVRGRSQVNFSLIGFVLVPYVYSLLKKVSN